MKNARPIILFTLAMAFGLGAAFLVQRTLETKPQILAVADVETTPVVVAGVDIAMASSLQGAQLKVVEWPVDYLPDGTFGDVGQLEGRIVRRPFAAGEAIQSVSIMPKDSAGGLEAVIAPNRRAVSVKVDPIIGVAGFVTPGSKVDVLATLRRLDWHSKQPYAKAVLQNVRVLAIDQKLEEVKGRDPELVSVVTLEVEPDDAEKLTFMSHEGKLQLALRSPTDTEEVKTRGVTVARLLGSAPRARSTSSLQVVKGTSVTNKSF